MKIDIHILYLITHKHTPILCIIINSAYMAKSYKDSLNVKTQQPTPQPLVQNNIIINNYNIINITQQQSCIELKNGVFVINGEVVFMGFRSTSPHEIRKHTSSKLVENHILDINDVEVCVDCGGGTSDAYYMWYGGKAELPFCQSCVEEPATNDVIKSVKDLFVEVDDSNELEICDLDEFEICESCEYATRNGYHASFDDNTTMLLCEECA